MKRFKISTKILAVVFAVLVSVTAVACDCSGGENNNENTFTAIDFVKNGVSDYKIVISADADNYEKYAAEELTLYIKESTNCELVTVTDENASFNENDKVLSVGRTRIFSESGVKAPYEELKRDGFVIKRLGNTLVLCGGGGYGTLYAVYEFLHRQIEWEAYAVNEIYYIKTLNLKLADLDITDKPAIEHRQGGYYEAGRDPYFAAKWRCYANMSTMLFGEEAWFYFPHAIFRMVPPSEYDSDHPEWYSHDANGNAMQPCFTNKEFEEQLVVNLEKIILDNPSMIFFPFGLEDTNNTMCKCEECTKEIEKYTKTGLVVRWVNRVTEKIAEWKKEACPDRELYFPFLAYYDTMNPPVSESGELIDETCRLNELSPVLYANIFADNDIPYYDEKHNSSVLAAINDWKKCSYSIMMYFYTNQYSRKFEWVDTVYTHTQNIKLSREIGATFVEDDASSTTFCGNALQRMYGYVYAKLLWNPDADTNALINDYITHFYREAAEEVRDYYYLFKMQTEHILDTFEENGGYYAFVGEMEGTYLNRGVLEQCIRTLKKGVEKIENADYYTRAEKETYIQRVEVEMLTPITYLLDYFDADYTTGGYLALVDEAEALLTKYGISEIKGDNSSLESVLNEWRNRKNG